MNVLVRFKSILFFFETFYDEINSTKEIMLCMVCRDLRQIILNAYGWTDP